MDGLVSGLIVVTLFLIIDSGTAAADNQKLTRKQLRRTNIDEVTSYYCWICPDHTMCRFPYVELGPNCTSGFENNELEGMEIEWILNRHNSLRDRIVRAWKSHGFWPMPVMMQVFWDEELAEIAHRWVLQCNIYDKDACRNVGRFTVMQNVNVIDLQELGNLTTLERLDFHLKTWYDEVNLEGPVDCVPGSGVGLATPSVTNVGCARASYNADSNSGQLLGWVEELVCNYGPIDRRKSGRCARPSRRYEELCMKLQEGFSRGEPEETSDELPFRPEEEYEPRYLQTEKEEETKKEEEPKKKLRVPTAASSSSDCYLSLLLLLPGLLLLLPGSLIRC